jgi:integrase
MVRKTGQIISRGSGRWLVRVYLGRTVHGKRKYVSKTVHGRKKDAEKALREKLKMKDDHRLVVPTKMTFGDFIEKWLTDAVKPRVQPSTLQSYRHALEANVIPELKDCPLPKLTPLHLQGVIAKMSEKGLKPRTIRYAMSLTNSALRQAMKWRLISVNPAEDLSLPRLERREMSVPTKEQITKLLEAARADSLWPLWRLMVSTGLRPGECLALKWQDIDFDTGRVVVQRALSRVKGEGWRVSTPKTNRSRRTVTAPSNTLSVLRQHRAAQAEARLKAGSSYKNHGFVFANGSGEPLDWSSVRRQHWLPMMKECGLDLRPYDLRHVHATLLLAEGVPIRAISERLGHFDAGFTLATYTHTMPGTQEAAAEAIERAAFGD